jgi:hypothetical protein
MQVNAHHPYVVDVRTLTRTEGGVFHILELGDIEGGGMIKLFIRGDWSDWNQLVSDVAAYRAKSET